MPFEKAEANTTTSGSTTKMVRKETASAMMMNLTGPGSLRRSRDAAAARGRPVASRLGGVMARSAVEAYFGSAVARDTKLVCIDIDRAPNARERGSAPSVADD